MGSRKAVKPLHYDLEVWKDGMRLAREVYRVSAAFPDSERIAAMLNVLISSKRSANDAGDCGGTR